MMEMGDNAESIWIKDLYVLSLFFILVAAVFNVVVIPPSQQRQLIYASRALEKLLKHCLNVKNLLYKSLLW